MNGVGFQSKVWNSSRVVLCEIRCERWRGGRTDRQTPRSPWEADGGEESTNVSLSRPFYFNPLLNSATLTGRRERNSCPPRLLWDCFLWRQRPSIYLARASSTKHLEEPLLRSQVPPTRHVASRHFAINDAMSVRTQTIPSTDNVTPAKNIFSRRISLRFYVAIRTRPHILKHPLDNPNTITICQTPFSTHNNCNNILLCCILQNYTT